MPKYKVQTDQGNFMVELDKEPSSPEELQSLVGQHLAGSGGQVDTVPAALTPQVAPKGQGQPLSLDTLFSQGPELPKEESMFTKLARQPAELVGKGVSAAVQSSLLNGPTGKAAGETAGNLASGIIPSTPAGWGGLAGSLAAAPLTGGMSFPAMAAITGGAAAVGGAGGSLLGGGTPEEALKEGAIQGAGQVVGVGIGKGLGVAGGYASRQLKGGTQKLLDEYGGKLARIIPGIGGEKLTPSRLFDVVVGGKGHEALSKTYQEGVDEIVRQVGPNAFLQDPAITSTIRDFLPKSRFTSSIATITNPITSQGATAPAHLVLGNSEPISIENAMKAAQEIGARARLAAAKPEGAILGRDMAQANQQLREAIGNELNRISAGAGDLYKKLNSDFRVGSTALGVLQDAQEKIFRQGPTEPKIDVSALQRALDMSLAQLRKVGAEDLATAARRGAPPGAGDITRRIPGSGLIFGGSGVRGRLSEGNIGIPSPTGAPGAQIPPQISGTLGQMLAEYLKRQQQQSAPATLESLGLR